MLHRVTQAAPASQAGPVGIYARRQNCLHLVSLHLQTGSTCICGKHTVYTSLRPSLPKRTRVICCEQMPKVTLKYRTFSVARILN